MTRRVRFTPLIRAGLFCAGALAARPAGAVDLPLVLQPPIATGVYLRGLVAGDVDRDGDVDLVACDLEMVYWYENVGGTFTPRTIFTSSNPGSLTLTDLDRDGDLDVLSSNFSNMTTQWHENVGGNGAAWTTRTIATQLYLMPGEAADIDRDGDLDLVAVGTGFVGWLEDTGAPSWAMHTVATGGAPGVSVGGIAVDVDGDGDLDIAGTTASNYGLDTRLYWAENTAGDGSAWTRHTIPFFQPYGLSGTLSAADIDGDGDPDLVLGTTNTFFGYSGPNVRWFENVAGNGTAWTIRTIGGAPANSANTRPVDLDGDGDVDVLTAFFQVPNADDLTIWFENGGNGSAWTRRTIATIDAPLIALPTDLDHDGDNDVLLASIVDTQRIDFFRNESIHRTAAFAPAAPISTSSLGAFSVAVTDVDGDGVMDVIGASFDDDTLRWHENVAGNGSAWGEHTIAAGVDGAAAVAAADVDRDGDVDVLSAALLGDRLAWHENVGGAGATWTLRTIDSAVDGVAAVSAADVDGDGDLDAVAASYYGGIRWFSNTLGNGSAWSGTTVLSGQSTTEAIADVDRDGDLDVMSSTGFFDPVVRWHSNTSGNGSTWSVRTVATVGSSAAYGAVVTDMDGDGDLDLVGSFFGGGASGVRWFANLDGAGTSWATNTITADDAMQVAVGDLDRDGDVDAVSSGLGADALRWHENVGGAWAQHSIATATDNCWGVAVADVDRDGDLDIVAATPGENRIDWFANQGGQFALAAIDVAPPGAMNGDLVAMLRLALTHRGHAGDGALELASLGLRLEEAAGDPLTTAEANALVESLRVYEDTNGSGMFEPATDLLVTSLPTLALTAGVQVVPLTDGDPNVQVTFGTPRTYFVVVELTADAGGQPVNHLRVTLLGRGPSASSAEDRTYDIALAPASPADVASTTMGATPVALMRFTVE